MITEHAEASREAPLATYRRSGRGIRRRYAHDSWGRAASVQPSGSAVAPYVEFARAWWWLILVGLIVGVGATVAYLRFGPIPHRSLAYILVPTQEGSASPSSPALAERAAGNFAVQASSPYVMSLVAGALPPAFGLDASALIRMVQAREVDIRPHRGSSLISISVTEQRPNVAQELANTIVRVFSKDVNDRAASQLDQRRQHLTQQIEATRQQLQTAQLNQRERDLAQQIQDQRAQLLQVQAQHQMQLQLQADAERQAQPAAVPAPAPARPALTAEQTRLLQSSIANRVEALRLLTQQQAEVEGNITRLNEELTAVRTTLTQLPADDSEEVQQQQAAAEAERLQVEEVRRQQDERTRLTQQETALNRELQSLRGQLLQVQTQAQQELQRQAEAERQTRLALTTPAGQPPLPPQERQRILDLATAASAVRTQALQLLDGQRNELEGRITLAAGQLAEVRTVLAALPPADPSAAAIAPGVASPPAGAQAAPTPPVGPVDQLRAERQRLAQREQAILGQQQALRTQLLQLHQLQAQSQQEVQRLLEDQRVPSVPASSVASQQRPPALQELAAATVSSRAQWLRILAEQQREVEQNIATTTQQLSEAREALAQRPASTDPALDAAFAQAFAGQLGELTAEYASLQMNAGIVTAPLVPYGTATEALPTVRAKRTLALGAAGGLVGGAAAAYALHVLRQARARRTQAAVAGALGSGRVWMRPAGAFGAPDGRGGGDDPSARLAVNRGARVGGAPTPLAPASGSVSAVHADGSDAAGD